MRLVSLLLLLLSVTSALAEQPLTHDRLYFDKCLSWDSTSRTCCVVPLNDCPRIPLKQYLVDKYSIDTRRYMLFVEYLDEVVLGQGPNNDVVHARIAFFLKLRGPHVMLWKEEFK